MKIQLSIPVLESGEIKNKLVEVTPEILETIKISGFNTQVNGNVVSVNWDCTYIMTEDVRTYEKGYKAHQTLQSLLHIDL